MYLPSPVNPVEAAFYSCKSALSVLGRSATGRTDLINSKRALADIKALRAALDKLEATCTDDLATRKAAAKAKRAADKSFVRRQLRYIERHPEVAARAKELGIPDRYVADGLVAMAKTVQEPEVGAPVLLRRAA